MTTTMHSEDMHPGIAEVMEAIRELLSISRRVQSHRSALEHRQTVAAAIPIVMGDKSAYAFAYPHLIASVADEEGISG